jgi:hypothetical protein
MRRVLLGAYLVGLIVRVALLPSKPFWRDEAWVAALIGPPLPGSVVPKWPCPVPIGFLALVRAVATPLGLSPEVGYRLVPLLAGLAALPLLAQLAAALGAAPAVTAIAVWLAAGMPALIYYSRELKSYGLDLLFAIVVPLLALRVLGRSADAPDRAAGTATFAALLAALAAAPWLSFGAIFPIAATLAWGWLTCWRHRDRRSARRWLAATAVAGLSFAAVFQVALAGQSTSGRLHDLWRPYLFASRGVYPEQIARALARYAVLPLWYFFPGLWPIAAALVVVGMCAWPRAQRALLAWLWAGPGLAAVAAALADRYLLAQGRLLLFAAPPLLLAVGCGLSWTGAALAGRTGIRLAFAAAVGLALFWSAAAIAHRLPPYRDDWNTYFRYDILHDVDALIAQTAELAAPGEPVLISLYTAWPFAYYGRGRLPGVTLCVEPCPQFPGVLADFLAHIRDGQRGWLLLLDEEQERLASAISAAGVAHRQRAAARGGAVWELVRESAAQPSSQ